MGVKPLPECLTTGGKPARPRLARVMLLGGLARQAQLGRCLIHLRMMQSTHRCAAAEKGMESVTMWHQRCDMGSRVFYCPLVMGCASGTVSNRVAK